MKLAGIEHISPPKAYAFRARIIKEGHDLGLDFYDPLIEALTGGSPDCGLCVILGLLD
jgi:hypothetical protein